MATEKEASPGLAPVVVPFSTPEKKKTTPEKKKIVVKKLKKTAPMAEMTEREEAGEAHTADLPCFSTFYPCEETLEKLGIVEDVHTLLKRIRLFDL